MDKPTPPAPRDKHNGHANGHDAAPPPVLTAKTANDGGNGAGNGQHLRDKKTSRVAKGKTAAAFDAKAEKQEPDTSNGDAPKSESRDWSKTLFLPHTDFGMKAGLPQLEPKLLERWAKMGLYKRLRKTAKGSEKFVLHDGPPYANAHIHVGTALNKILKDAVTRSRQMLGYDSNYVPGFDCHGLPIEWKVEEQYRAKGKNKDDVPIADFRRECREYAQHWIGVQVEEFKRLGVEGDWDNYYTTMAYEAEAAIAGELLKFAMNGSLYRGSKPVMWSVVERTALAEAEIEYKEVQSPAVWVKFPVKLQSHGKSWLETADRRRALKEADPLSYLDGASVIIWTTTPWTIPANKAISFSSKIEYGLYRVLSAPESLGMREREYFIIAENRLEEFKKSAKIMEVVRERIVQPDDLQSLECSHPFGQHILPNNENFRVGDGIYDYRVPLLDGSHVTDEAGTGFVHTAPSHGLDDFEIWTASTRLLSERGIDPAIPNFVGPDGRYTYEAVGFANKSIIDDKGSFGLFHGKINPEDPEKSFGDQRYANAAVVKALYVAGALAAWQPNKSDKPYKHDYPHSWRSKAPVIFRNTPQWFIAIDKRIKIEAAVKQKKSETRTKSDPKISFTQASNAMSSPMKQDEQVTGAGEQGHTIRELALKALDNTRFVPPQGRNRIGGMIEARPDYVISRQRVWGVPIAIFVHKQTGEIIPNANWKYSKKYIKRLIETFAAEGVDPWFDAPDRAGPRFLFGLVDDTADWEQVRDTLDVWFDSASTHVFVLKKRKDLKWPADVYLEGSDQHRGWFHSTLLESCGTVGRAPYDTLVTHGFTLDEKGEQKMSKSLGNTVSPMDVCKQYGADILRLWALSSDYTNDIRFGPTVLKGTVDAYRKVRNTLRYVLGNLAHFEPALAVAYADMPELERWVLHRVVEVDGLVRQAYLDYDFKRAYRAVSEFCNGDLSALYFDIRKDTLYCEPYSSVKRRAALTVLDILHRYLCTWLEPILAFTTEEAWLARHGDGKGVSVHLETIPVPDPAWLDETLAAKWEQVFQVRRVITGALEVERREKRIGSSLEAAPEIIIADKALAAAVNDIDWAEIAITSGAKLKSGKVPEGAFTLDEVVGVAVVPKLAKGKKCARSWRITNDVGLDADYPELSARDAAAMREFNLQVGA